MLFFTDRLQNSPEMAPLENFEKEHLSSYKNSYSPEAINCGDKKNVDVYEVTPEGTIFPKK